MIDTLTIDTMQNVISEVVNTSIAIHENTGGGSIIKGIDNGLIGSVVSLLIAAIIRHFEKRKIKRKYDK
jgi:hypothetical protein